MAGNVDTEQIGYGAEEIYNKIYVTYQTIRKPKNKTITVQKHHPSIKQILMLLKRINFFIQHLRS